MKKVIDRIISILCIALIVFSVILVVASIILKTADKVVFVGKYAVVKITTESMEPTLPTGGYILLEKADTATLKKGDIITFYSEDPSIYGSLNTHRIVGSVGGKFVTKGDNNLVKDEYTVAKESVVGVFSKKLTFFQSMMEVLSNPFAYFVLILLPIVILVVISVKDVMLAAKIKRESDEIELVLEKMKESGELDEYINSSANSEKDLNESEEDCTSKQDDSSEDKNSK